MTFIINIFGDLIGAYMQAESQQKPQEQEGAAASCSVSGDAVSGDAVSGDSAPASSSPAKTGAPIWIEKITEEGRYGLFGEMDIDTVKITRDLVYPLLKSNDVLEIDFGGVVRVDSVGLGLLIEWVRESKKLRKEIRYYNIPEQLCAIARVSSLELVLPLFRG